MKQKNILIVLLLSTLFSLPLFAKAISVDKETLKQFKEQYKILQDPTLTLLEGVDEGETYFLKLEYKKKTYAKIMYAFVTKKTGHLYVGTRYNKDGSVSEFPKTEQAIKQIKEGVFFSFGSGKKELYLVTDPDCRYCKKFEKASEGKLDNYRIHVILHPFSFHTKSPKMVEWIMQGKDEAQKKQRMHDVMLNGSAEYKAVQVSDKIKKQIKKGHTAVQALGAIGSPMLFDAQFNYVDTKSITK